MFVLANVKCTQEHFFLNLSSSESYVGFGFFRSIIKIFISFLSFKTQQRPGFHFTLSKTEFCLVCNNFVQEKMAWKCCCLGRKYVPSWLLFKSFMFCTINKIHLYNFYEINHSFFGSTGQHILIRNTCYYCLSCQFYQLKVKMEKKVWLSSMIR